MRSATNLSMSVRGNTVTLGLSDLSQRKVGKQLSEPWGAARVVKVSAIERLDSEAFSSWLEDQLETEQSDIVVGWSWQTVSAVGYLCVSACASMAVDYQLHNQPSNVWSFKMADS